MVPGEKINSSSGDARSAESDSQERSDPWVIDAIREELFDDPLEFIFAEHTRQRQAALVLHLIADGEFDRQGVANLIGFLEGDFARHVGDEELGFFPVLRQRCAPEDNIDALIRRLADEHQADEAIGDEVLDILKGLLAGEPLRADKGRRLRMFAEHIRQHLAVENAVLLPIARVRMDEGALAAFSEILKQRHARSGKKSS